MGPGAAPRRPLLPLSPLNTWCQRCARPLLSTGSPSSAAFSARFLLLLRFLLHMSRGKRYAKVMIRLLKKKRGPLAPKVPQYIAEQEDVDGADAYWALRRLSELPLWAGGDGPLFSTAGGRPMTTARFRAPVKKYASALGFGSEGLGAHSARIGGHRRGQLGSTLRSCSRRRAGGGRTLVRFTRG